MSESSTDVQAGLALSASWGHPEMLQVQDSGWDFTSQAHEVGRRKRLPHC
jgi:hypothetical protein